MDAVFQAQPLDRWLEMHKRISEKENVPRPAVKQAKTKLDTHLPYEMQPPNLAGQ